MKRFIISQILVLVVFFSNTIFLSSTLRGNVNANGLYLRIITEDTPFYTDEKSVEPLFYLPYTYYVKVLSYGKDFTHVECYIQNSVTIDGYVPSDMLFNDGLEITYPYPDILIETSKTAVLYQDSSLKTPIQYLFSQRKLKYFGTKKLDDGTILYYVSYNDKLGYVLEECVMPFVINNHPNPLTFIVEQPEETPPDEQPVEQPVQNKENDKTLQYVIIGCIGFAGLLALFLVFFKRPTKPARNTDYFEEGNYE